MEIGGEEIADRFPGNDSAILSISARAEHPQTYHEEWGIL
jgi:hypothetical protein